MRKVLSLAIGSLAVWLAGPALAESKKVAIASFGEHPALQLVIDGFKASMKERGYGDDKLTITFTHVNWERNLIPQMLTKIVADKPDVVVTITTPVSQTAVRALTGSGHSGRFRRRSGPGRGGTYPCLGQGRPEHDGCLEPRGHGWHRQIHQGDDPGDQAPRRSLTIRATMQTTRCARISPPPPQNTISNL